MQLYFNALPQHIKPDHFSCIMHVRHRSNNRGQCFISWRPFSFDSLSIAQAHTEKNVLKHTLALLGQVPQEIIIQLQNEDQKCHPLLLRSSSANPFLLGFGVFLHTCFVFFYTLSVLLQMWAGFFCFLKCALFTCPLYSSAPPLLLTVSAFFFPTAFPPLFLISVFPSLLSLHNRWQSHPWLGLSLSLTLTHADWMKDFCHAVCFGEGCFKAAIFREREQARSGK